MACLLNLHNVVKVNLHLATTWKQKYFYLNFVEFCIFLIKSFKKVFTIIIFLMVRNSFVTKFQINISDEENQKTMKIK